MSQNIVPTPALEDFSGSGAVKMVPPPPPPQKPSILHFFTLLFLSVVAVIAIYLFLQVRQLALEKTSPSPTPTPTASVDPSADWNTYSDSKYNFSFKYPKKYSIRQVARKEGDGQIYYFEPVDNFQLVIIVQDKYKKELVSDPDKYGSNKLGAYSWAFLPREDKSSLFPDADVSSYALQHEFNQKLFTFIQPNEPMLTDDGFQILSTFKFIEE